MKQAPSAKVRKTLQGASRTALQQSFSLLRPHLFKHRWVGKQNRYRKDTVNRLALDTKPGGRGVNHLHLCQYIAASAPLHCSDGWVFLGRALDCHSRRDYDSARHLAYYAELRAAFSLLATEGIGIFNNKHFAVDRVRQVHYFEGNTHKIIWQVLEYWASLKRAVDLLGTIIRINGINLADWLSHFLPSGSFRPVGSKWLKTWGLDLRSFPGDRETRNEASYRPTQLGERAFLEATTSSDFVCALWSLCEPSGYSPFESIDRHLLRLALEEAFRGLRGVTVATTGGAFDNQVRSMLSTLGLDPVSQAQWFNFLVRSSDQADPIILSKASKTATVEDPEQHLEVISRAALLLRIATGANSLMLKEIGISLQDIKFWWSNLGEQRGLWEKAEEPADLRDLWADVEAAIREMTEWRGDGPSPERTFIRWRQDRLLDISVLGECERIGLWGLAL
jgi:hypothetical protein